MKAGNTWIITAEKYIIFIECQISQIMKLVLCLKHFSNLQNTFKPASIAYRANTCWYLKGNCPFKPSRYCT